MQNVKNVIVIVTTIYGHRSILHETYLLNSHVSIGPTTIFLRIFIVIKESFCTHNTFLI